LKNFHQGPANFFSIKVWLQKVKHMYLNFWALFAATACFVLAQVPDPDTAARIAGMIKGIIP
jgi:hypothetical protein